MRLRPIALFCAGALFHVLCAPAESVCQELDPALFTLLPPGRTNVWFTNHVIEDRSFYMQNFIYAYNGGGVAVGDLNGDGLPDMYFSGTQSHSPNRLYINKGDFRFEEISARAGVDDSTGVRFGVAMIDIEADGDLDIYLCKQDYPNRLYINNGDLTFTDRAAEYGLDYCCSSTQATFFDYDRDGDLDLYLGINGKARESAPMVKGLPDRFFRNDGGRFVDVTEQTGIRDLAYALSISVGDFNDDGWPDMFVANDFQEPDALYINNGDGSFTNGMGTLMPHTSVSSMGSDAADFNNDGLLDIITLDMVPETHWRKMSSATSRSTYSPTFDSAQLMRNTLQLNRGGGYFSDIAQLAGIAETDWSWAPLIADFDNDGWKDIFISNGFKRDMQNLDVMTYLDAAYDPLAITHSIPTLKLPNYLFRNNSDLTFRNVTTDWGLDQVVNSNGAAFADLDLDGDLDLVVNNLDSVAFIYRNNTVELGKGNFLQFELHGSGANPDGIGARVEIRHGEAMQVQQMTAVRGYLSSVHPLIHFGLGTSRSVDRVTVRWPDGTEQALRHVAANQQLIVRQKDAVRLKDETSSAGDERSAPFRDAGASAIAYRHRESGYDDFNRERLMPNRHSRNGPGTAVGDANGDGLDDVWIGGSSGYAGALYLQRPDGSFEMSADSACFHNDAAHEDMGGLFFDADGDLDLDLYVVSGGNECHAGDTVLRDRLYVNDGTGTFHRDADALPEMTSSGSCVIAADYDLDGDPDLFVAGRVIPGRYPDPPASSLLRNDGGRFTDVTSDVAPAVVASGMITSALWTDYDNDNDPDLLTVGEWMTPRLYRNDAGTFVDVTAGSGLDGFEGWWNSVVGADFDGDGDIDYVIGNLGRNTKPELRASPEFPLRIYANDFDGNTSRDLVMSYYYQGLEYPTRNKNDAASQMGTYIKRRFPTAVSYAVATIPQMYAPEKLDSAVRLHATTLWSAYVENLGDGRFRVTPLPTLAQLSPVHGMIADDFDADGDADVLLVDNFHSPDGSVIRYDAGYGLLLAGDGKGGFTPVDFNRSGFRVSCDARSLASVYVNSTGGLHVITACNNQHTVDYLFNPSPGMFLKPDPAERCTHAMVKTEKEGTRRVEFHRGSGYLSQSSVGLIVAPAVQEVTLYSGDREVRTVKP